MTADARPSGPSTTLRVQSGSRAAFGATTAALVALASGGVAVLVSHGTSGVTAQGGFPGGTTPGLGGLGVGRVVVERAVGAVASPLQPDRPTRVTPLDDGQRILRVALGQPVSGGRSVVVTPPVGPVVPESPLLGGPAPAPVPDVARPPVVPVNTVRPPTDAKPAKAPKPAKSAKPEKAPKPPKASTPVQPRPPALAPRPPAPREDTAVDRKGRPQAQVEADRKSKAEKADKAKKAKKAKAKAKKAK